MAISALIYMYIVRGFNVLMFLLSPVMCLSYFLYRSLVTLLAAPVESNRHHLSCVDCLKG